MNFIYFEENFLYVIVLGVVENWVYQFDQVVLNQVYLLNFWLVGMVFISFYDFMFFEFGSIIILLFILFVQFSLGGFFSGFLGGGGFFGGGGGGGGGW